ncbi:lob domain-containing protein 22 [Quercus suber]|uniref:Lob domain-containing protein 22 n=1 Tax=Quercus suber TaxID=58331 RepID=A0AAW0KP06_QUESU
MTLTTKSACAACKYQRRKCGKDCPLAPFFPAEEFKSFQYAHRLFGVSNIMKILKQVHPADREKAMRSVKYESEMWAKFPNTGCYGIVQQLQLRLQEATGELQSLLPDLVRIYKDRIKKHYSHSPPSQLPLDITYLQSQCQPQQKAAADYLSISQYITNLKGQCQYQQKSDYLPPSQLQSDITTTSNTVSIYQQHLNIPINEKGLYIDGKLNVQPPSEGFPFHHSDYENMVDKFKEVCDSSTESTSKDTIHSVNHVPQNVLKSTAT